MRGFYPAEGGWFRQIKTARKKRAVLKQMQGFYFTFTLKPALCAETSGIYIL